MRHSIFYLLLLLLSCCSLRPVQFQDLDKLDIGKNQTAIHGRIKSIVEKEDQILLIISVLTSRQGGSNSPAIAKGSVISAVCSPIFIRAYEDKMDAEIIHEIEESQDIIIYISKSLKNSYYSSNYLNTLSK
jgi:hypothetical protein